MAIAKAPSNRDADAIAPVQVHRTKPTALMTVMGEDGKRADKLEWEFFSPELSRVHTAHFGMTLLRVSALREVSKPWFVGTPDDEGGWGDARTDEDIHFWENWSEAGRTLYLANRVAIGHAELMIRWPGKNLTATYQHPSDFWTDGKPEELWR